MLPPTLEGVELIIKVARIPEPTEQEKAEMHSIIGHPDTAAIVGVPCNRENYILNTDVELTVAQYTGPRLEPGTTQLPAGAQIQYYRVTLE